MDVESWQVFDRASVLQKGLDVLLKDSEIGTAVCNVYLNSFMQGNKGFYIEKGPRQNRCNKVHELRINFCDTSFSNQVSQ